MYKIAGSQLFSKNHIVNLYLYSPINSTLVPINYLQTINTIFKPSMTVVKLEGAGEPWPQTSTRKKYYIYV